jgi:3-hydroxyisobutyrate dehydrogenase-like beta-hydroxyacid dehydrogenase
VGENRAVKVAVLGTGKMGGAVARRLATMGHDLTTWNRTREKAEALGVGIVAATPAEAAADAEVVLSVFTDGAAARAAYSGEDGAMLAAEGRVFVDMTTVGPESARWLDREVTARGGRFLEAPVMGGPASIENGKLMILAGGEPGTLDVAREVLVVLGEVRHIGEIGTPSRLKLVSNSMLAGLSALAAELQAGGEEAGLGRDDVFWVLQRMAPYLEVRKAGYLEQRYQPSMFSLRDMVKDLDLALEVLRGAGAEVPLIELTRGLYAGELDGHGGDDMSAINARYRGQDG